MRNLIVASAVVAAAMLAATPGAFAQSGNPARKAFCLQETQGVLDCNFDSMAQCEAAKKRLGMSLSCVPLPSENTGAGGGDRMPSPVPRQPAR